jgi:rhamnosyltransferase
MIRAAIIVAYNPNEASVGKILSNAQLFDLCIIVDNSDKTNKLLSSIQESDDEKILYVGMGGNVGIGAALNSGINMLLERDIKWVTTLDQDSELKYDYFSLLPENLYTTKIGIISPVHTRKGRPIERIAVDGSIMEVESVMMSGNLLSLEAYRKCGGFNEDYFIDYVDTEYCLRLRANGYKVYLSGLVSMDHELGSSKWYNIGRFKIKVTNHDPNRRYYISRNRVITALTYFRDEPSFVRGELIRFIKETLYIIVFEKNKRPKLISTILGVRDGIKRSGGKIKNYGNEI